MQVQLKQRDYDTKNILLLQKLIPQKIVFALEYDEDVQFCIFHTRLQQSEWKHASDAEIPLTGLTLDEVWENIVAVIGGLDAQSEESIEEQTEKQTRKKYELHQQIIKLKKELAE